MPGVGTFLLDRIPATIDFPNKKAIPPLYAFSLDSKESSPPRFFFNWLASVLHLSDLDAIAQFNSFVFDLKKQVNGGDIINWKGVGELKKSNTGEIKFTAVAPRSPEQPVPAIKVLRQKAEHTIRVGEDEKTAAEMVEMLSKPEEKRSWWWAGGLVIGLLSVLFLGWYFSEHGVESSSTANLKKLVVPEATATYRQVP